MLSALAKLQRLVYIFRNRYRFLALLKTQCLANNVKFKRPQLDMPIRWNSTHNMLKIALHLRTPINATCVLQDLDKSVKNLNLFNLDWETIEQLANCFQIYASTTIKMQGETRPTLN